MQGLASMRIAAGVAKVVLFAGLSLLFVATASRAEVKTISPFAATEVAPGPPLAFAPPTAAPFQAPGPLGRVFAWVFELHAVGPGHGKTIISSYVVANEETVRRGVIISFIAAGLQALTAIALVGILAFALNASGMQINAWSNQLALVGCAPIALVGAWLLTTH